MPPITLEQFIANLRIAGQREPLMRQTALRHAAEHIRDAAKALVGTEDRDWAPLAESSIREKGRLGYVGRVSATDPLLRTGELRDSIEVGPVSAERAVVGSDDPIARYQEFGTGRIPPRPFLGTALFREKASVERLIGEAAVRLLRGQADG